uniref:Fibronectin type-II domain-containing protein n=1 Tax=Ascaris lumbricoides TaxID=6252 RepID=A0A0M3HYL3_ASCLU
MSFWHRSRDYCSSRLGMGRGAYHAELGCFDFDKNEHDNGWCATKVGATGETCFFVPADPDSRLEFFRHPVGERDDPSDFDKLSKNMRDNCNPCVVTIATDDEWFEVAKGMGVSLLGIVVVLMRSRRFRVAETNQTTAQAPEITVGRANRADKPQSFTAEKS